MTALHPDPLDQIMLGLRETRELLAETKRLLDERTAATQALLDARTDATILKVDALTDKVESLRGEHDGPEG